MPIVRSVVRNSPQSVLFSFILLFIFCVFAFVLHLNSEIFTQVIEFKDPTSLFLLSFGIVTIIVLACLIHPLLLFGFENFMSGQNSSILNRLWNHLKGHEYLWYLIYPDLIGCIGLVYLGYHSMESKFDWNDWRGIIFASIRYFLVIISTSILIACVTVWVDYDDVDLSSSQNLEKSIGACWAYGAYSAFYKKILLDITKRMSQFEEEHGIRLLVKKLVIICPLSCNANGSLAGKDGNIKAEGNLEVIIEDEGANNNRTLKTNVYKIQGPDESYIAAEIPSPLATLYEMRDIMDPVILQYHRECFIKTLKDLLKSDPCIILEYDDLNSPEPLHSFLLSKLEDKRFVSVIK